MAGYAAGCEKGYRRGSQHGAEQAVRERSILLTELLRLLGRYPRELHRLAANSCGTDAREDRFLLAKLIREALRQAQPDDQRTNFDDWLLHQERIDYPNN